MNTVRAYYDGEAFVPMEPCPALKGSIVKLSIEREDIADAAAAKKLAAFERITYNLRELDKTEPLSPEFNEIMSERVNFSGGSDL